MLAATVCGCGFAPHAPGTVASALGAAVWWLLLAELDPLARAAAAAAAFAAGWFVVRRLVERYAVGDEPAIVVDEIAGVWTALLFTPKSLPWALAALALFRVADIAKPWPISWIERRVGGALGVMLDDLAAGALAAAALLAAGRIFDAL